MAGSWLTPICSKVTPILRQKPLWGKETEEEGTETDERQETGMAAPSQPAGRDKKSDMREESERKLTG